MYYALVHSYLRYGIVLWGNAREAVLRPLQNLINKALRIMTFAPFGRIELEPLYEYLKVLKVKEVFLLETGKCMYKMENNLLPVSMGDYFQPRKQNNSGYNLRTRKNTSTAPITYRLISSERSIHYHGANLWKNIPNEIIKNKSPKNITKLFQLLITGPSIRQKLKMLVTTRTRFCISASKVFRFLLFFWTYFQERLTSFPKN